MAKQKKKKAASAPTAKAGAAARKTPPARKKIAYKGIKTLAFDIGGTGLKAALLDENGEMLTERVRIATPQPCPPKTLLEKLKELTRQLPPFDRVSVGFPGPVRKGKTISCANLGSDEWNRFDLRSAIAKQTGKPTLVINDADMQGLGAIKGDGIELVITVGTGVGSAFFEDGRLAPHLELAHIPFRQGETYEEQLGNQAFKKVGKKEWNRRLEKAIECFRTLTNFDHLYIGGGNAANVEFKLGSDIEIVPNTLGMIGGIWLWKDANLDDGIQK